MMNFWNTYWLHPTGHSPPPTLFLGPRKGLHGWGSVGETGDHGSMLPSSWLGLALTKPHCWFCQGGIRVPGKQVSQVERGAKACLWAPRDFPLWRWDWGALSQALGVLPVTLQKGK